MKKLALVSFTIASALLAGAAAAQTTWTGTTSSAWNTASNWDTGTVPSSSDDVSIPPGTPNAPSASSGTARCQNLTVQAGATLTVGSTLEVSGGADGGGTVVSAGAGKMRFAGTGVHAITLSPLPNVEIDDGDYTLTDVTITGNLWHTFNSSFDLTIAGTVTIDGNATFEGGAVEDQNGSTLIVGGKVDFRASNTVRNPPSRIISKGNWSATQSFTPTTGTIIFGGTGKQKVESNEFIARNVRIEATAQVEAPGEMHVGEYSFGGQPLIGGVLEIAGKLSVFANPFTSAAVVEAGRIEVSGTGSIDYVGTLPLTVTVQESLEVDGALALPSTAQIVLQGKGASNVVDVAAGVVLPELRIEGGDYRLLSATVGGNLVQETGAGVVEIGTVSALKDATFEGQGLAGASGTSSSLDVDGKLTVRTTATVTDPPAEIRCAGDWTSTSFDPTSGTVVFDGSGAQAISNSSARWHGLTIDKPAGTITAGAAVTVGGDLRLERGGFDLAAGITVQVLGDGLLAGGTLGGAAGSVLDVDGVVTFAGAALGASPPTIRCGGDWAADQTFAPQSGVVVLDGANPSSIHATGGTLAFAELQVENGVRTFAGRTALDAPVVRIGSGTLDLGGERVDFLGTALTVDGTLAVGADGVLYLDSQGTPGMASVLVTPGGTLRLRGAPATPARVLGTVGGDYGLTIDGTVDASEYEFRDMGPAGVRLGVSAQVAPAPHDLRGGVFGFGSPAPSSVLLEIARSADLDLTDVVFDDWDGTARFNVRSTPTTGKVRFLAANGNFAGEDHDDDPRDVIDWPAFDRTEATLDARGGVERIELRWTTVREVDAEMFVILRGPSTSGPFSTVIGMVPAKGVPSTYALTDTTPNPQLRYHYQLVELHRRQVLRALDTGSARSLSRDLGGMRVVGAGGYAGIQAALTGAPAGTNVLVLPGTYAPFTATGPGRILADEPGTVVIDTTTAPVVLRDLAASAGDLSVYGLEVRGAFGIEVRNCDDVVVLDEVSVSVGPGVTGLLVDDSPRVAVQTCVLMSGAGGSGLTVDNGATVYLSAGMIDRLVVQNASSVTHAGVTPGTVQKDPSSTVRALAGTMPRLDFPLRWSSNATVELSVASDPGDLWAISSAFRKDFVDLSTILPIDMVLLLDLNGLFTVAQGVLPAAGPGQVEFSITLPVVPASWGYGQSLALFVIHPDPLAPRGRAGNVRDILFSP